MSKENGNVHIATTSKLDAIKEIIFGQTMQEYDQRFSTIERLLQNEMKQQQSANDNSFKEIRKEIKDLRSHIDKELQDLKKQVAKEIAAMNEVKADRKVLKKYLIQLAENL